MLKKFLVFKRKGGVIVYKFSKTEGTRTHDTKKSGLVKFTENK